MKRLIGILIFFSLALGLSQSVLAAVDVACPTGLDSDLCKQVKTAKGEDSQSKITQIINTILPWVGGAAVLMLTYAGFIYSTSSGNAEKVKLAKDIIKYTVIGIIVIMLAGIIIGFAIEQVTTL